MSRFLRKGGAFARRVAFSVALLPIVGCADINMQQVGEGEAPTVIGPSVRANRTPLEGAFTCFGNAIRARPANPLIIAVGDIRDYTGKYNINEGNAITQGGSLMVYSALGKLNNAVKIANRYNYDVAQIELNFLNQRVLGTGQPQVLVENGQEREVPWLPYYGGSVIASDYFIAGGITELNYNVQTGGAEVRIGQVGPKARVFTLNIGVDLQIVDTRTLLVADTVSLSKQITGYEVGFDVFRFFNTSLYDINIGNKSEEPLQLGVRTTLEDAVLQLISTVTRVPYAACMDSVGQRIPEHAADLPYGTTAAAAAVPTGLSAAPAAVAPAVGTATAPAVVPAAAEEPAGGASPWRTAALSEDASPRVAEAPSAPATGDAFAPSDTEAQVPEAADMEESELAIQNGTMGSDDDAFKLPFDYGSTSLSGQALGVIDRIAATARERAIPVMLVALVNENWAPSKRASLLAARVESVRKALMIRGVTNVGLQWAPEPTSTGIVLDGAGFQKVALLVAAA